MDDATRILLEGIKKQKLKRGVAMPSYSLWPQEYCSCDPETACKFIFEKVWTYDESDGTDQRIEDSWYLREIAKDWYECLLSGKPLHLVKSRRMIVSWFCAALELHYAGVKRTKVGIAAQAFEGTGGSEGFVWRTAYLYDQIRHRNKDWGVPAPLVQGPMPRGAMEQLVLANGSRFIALNSDPDKVQGAGCGITRVEELATYRSPGMTWSQFRTINQGRPGEPGGFTYSVANVSESDEYAELVKPHETPEWWGDRLLSYGEYLRFDGPYRTVSCHYACDPLKATKEWVESAQVGKTQDFWDQQFEGIRNNIAGERVISNYDPEIHAHSCEFPKLGTGGVIVTGWDVGSTMSPAFVLLHVEPTMGQIQVLAEYVPDVAMPMDEFAPSVDKLLDKVWPTWRGCRNLFVNECDPAGRNRSGTGTGSSAMQTAFKKGWNLTIASTNDIDKRVGVVQEAFMEFIDEGIPRLIIDRHKCPRLHNALYRSYVFHDNKLKGDSRILRRPKKDRASDIADALQYALLRAMNLVHKDRAKIRNRARVRRNVGKEDVFV